MRIIFVGGGTLGSVSPLIAVAKQLKEKDPHTAILWVGTKRGPERAVVVMYGYPYSAIPSGKLRRYFSLRNFFDVFLIFLGFAKSLYILWRFRPDFIIGAGSFVQVPVMYASALFFKKSKIILHQQDIKRGLANTLCSKFAHTITVSTERSLQDFPLKKVILTGNPYKKEILTGNPGVAYQIFHLQKDLPVILVLGGSTGAASLNTLIFESINDLTEFSQILHVTGASVNLPSKNMKHPHRYHVFPFMNDMLKHAYAVSDVVISRAGFSTLTELAILAKPTLLIPIQGSHQETNAEYFKVKNSVVVLPERGTHPPEFVQTIKEILTNSELRLQLSLNISRMLQSDAIELFIQEIAKLTTKNIALTKW